MAKAFTLIELILVISMVSILLGLIPSSFGRLVSALELDAAVEKLVVDLHLARELALAYHLTVITDFLSDNPATYRISLSDGQIIKTVDLPKGVQLSQKRAIKFSASGFPSFGGSGTIELKNKQGKSRMIVVSSVGRIRIE